MFVLNRDVAQSGSAHGWGPCGRRFKSCHPDFSELHLMVKILYNMKLNSSFSAL